MLCVGCGYCLQSSVAAVDLRCGVCCVMSGVFSFVCSCWSFRCCCLMFVGWRLSCGVVCVLLLVSLVVIWCVDTLCLMLRAVVDLRYDVYGVNVCVSLFVLLIVVVSVS